MKRDIKRMQAFLIRKRLASHLNRLTSSINPNRIVKIQSKMITPNYTHEGKGHSSKIDRVAVGLPDGSFIGMSRYRITKPTTIHGKGPTGFYRGIYR